MQILVLVHEIEMSLRIEKFIREVLLNREINIISIDSFEAGKNYLRKNTIDLLFLDLDMNRKEKEVFEEVISPLFYTIVISDFLYKAATAFEYNVLDFIPKSFDRKRIEKAIRKLENKIARKNDGIKFLAIRKRGHINLMSVNEILFIRGAGIYVEVCFRNGDKEVHDRSMERLMKLLPGNYERIHRSYIVDMNEVECIKSYQGSKYEMVLKNNMVLPVGRTRYRMIKTKWFI